MCRKQVFDIGEHGAGTGLFEDADTVPAPQAGRNGRKFHLLPAASTSLVSMPSF